MLIDWFRKLSAARSNSEAQRARRLALAMGRMELESPNGREWLDAAVDLNLPELLKKTPRRSSSRDRRAPSGAPSRLDPRSPGWSLLHEASYRGHWACVEALLRRGANPHARAQGGVAPLQALFLFDANRTPNKRDGGCPGPEGVELSESDALLTAQALLRSGAAPAGGELARAAFLGWGPVCAALLDSGASSRERPDERFDQDLLDYCVDAFWEGPRSPKTIERLACLTPIPALLALLSGSIGAVRALAAPLSDFEVENAAAFAAGSNRLSLALALLAERPNAGAQAALCALARRPQAEDSEAAASLARWLISRGANPRLGAPLSGSPYSAIEEAARAHKPLIAQALAESLRGAELGESELSFLTRLVEHHPRGDAPASISALRQSASRACFEGLSIGSAIGSAQAEARPRREERRRL